jgi:pimeloyl-ACP methyl ester carboxylesterase
MVPSLRRNGTVVGTMSAPASQPVRRPSRLLLAAEAPRALGEMVLLQAARPLLAKAPRGDGHPVLVLPGLGADDRSTIPLRRFLRRLGYRVHGWRLGINVPSPETIDGLRRRVTDLRTQDSRPMSIVGWSLGGIYARGIARSAPDAVRAVVTLGSPFRPVPGQESNAAPLARLWGASAPEGARRAEDGPLPVPSTSVFSRSDGVVPWRACLDAASGPHETIEVLGSHLGLGHHPAVLFVVADRLAQPAGAWRRMRIPAPWRPLLRHHTGDGGDAAGRPPAGGRSQASSKPV